MQVTFDSSEENHLVVYREKANRCFPITNTDKNLQFLYNNKNDDDELYGYFKRQTDEKTWIWLRKRNLKRENEPLLIAVQIIP